MASTSGFVDATLAHDDRARVTRRGFKVARQRVVPWVKSDSTTAPAVFAFSPACLFLEIRGAILSQPKEDNIQEIILCAELVLRKCKRHGSAKH